MPFFELKTNLSKHKFTPELLKRIAQKTADLLGLLPIQIEVVISADQLLTFSGTTEPAAIVNLTAVIGLGNADVNRPIIQGLSSFFEKELGLKNDRILLLLHKGAADSIRFHGQLVTDLLSKSNK